jgi:SecD/SecF fusion protein
MGKNFRWKVIGILIVIVLSLWFLYPTAKVVNMSKEEKDQLAKEDYKKLVALEDKSLHLGLDLKGGMYLILEVDKSSLNESEAKDARQRALEIIRNRVDEFGVAEPTIQPQGDDRIVVQLPGISDPARAKALIGKTALLEFKLVVKPDQYSDVFNKIDQYLKSKMPQKSNPENAPAESKTGAAAEAEQKEQAASQAENKPEEAKTGSEFDQVLKETGAEEIDEEVNELDKDKPFTSLLSFLGNNRFIVVEEYSQSVRQILEDPEVQKVIPEHLQVSLGMETETIQSEQGTLKFKEIYVLEKVPILKGEAIANARTISDSNRPGNFNVSISMQRKFARTFSKFTGENIGRRLAIVLDGRVSTAPNIKTKIPGGNAQIEGTFTAQEANDLSILLRSGALPAPLKIIQERTIGPSLGADSIKLGIIAAIIGLVVNTLYMIFYYRVSGFVADIILILNMILTLGALATFKSTLTLPGIAGMILTIGMAVDANILIFERIREEIRSGKSIRACIEAGYTRAFTAIFDSNVTTLITAIILYYFGTGPVKGFAVTLTIGICTSMFTAIIVSRVVFDYLYGRGNVKKISI